MIKLHNVSKAFDSSKLNFKDFPNIINRSTYHAVSNLNFECRPGRVFALLGANGAGKTTTLRMIATMLKPTAGKIEVCGFDTVNDGEKVRSKIGFLTGSTGLYDR